MVLIIIVQIIIFILINWCQFAFLRVRIDTLQFLDERVEAWLQGDILRLDFSWLFLNWRFEKAVKTHLANAAGLVRFGWAASWPNCDTEVSCLHVLVLSCLIRSICDFLFFHPFITTIVWRIVWWWCLLVDLESDSVEHFIKILGDLRIPLELKHNPITGLILIRAGFKAHFVQQHG